jgi:sphingosine-1-phosphate phosphatase 1
MNSLHLFTSQWVSSGTSTVVSFQRICGVTQNGPTKPILHLLMIIGAGLGNELFFISFLPFLFWEADDSIARRITMQWGLVYYVGQALKDMVQLPRPPATIVLDAASVQSVLDVIKTPRFRSETIINSNTNNSTKIDYEGVVRLERHYETEGGMPSTHAMNAVSMPWLIYHLGKDKAHAAFGSTIPLFIMACLWTILCVTSRLYLGVHSPADIIVGIFLGVIIMSTTVSFGDSLDRWVLYGPNAYLIIILVTIFLVIIYPRPKSPRWISTPGDTALIMGAISGIFCSSRLCVDIININNGSNSTEKIVFTDSIGGMGGVGSLVRTFCGFLVLILTRAICKPVFVALFETLFGPEYVLESDLISTPTSRSLGNAKRSNNNEEGDTTTEKDVNVNEKNEGGQGSLRRRHIDLQYDTTSKNTFVDDLILTEEDVVKGKIIETKNTVPKLKISSSVIDTKVKVPSGQRYAIELPTKYCVYFIVGFNCLFTCKLLFQQMGGISKDFGLPNFF